MPQNETGKTVQTNIIRAEERIRASGNDPHKQTHVVEPLHAPSSAPRALPELILELIMPELFAPSF